MKLGAFVFLSLLLCGQAMGQYIVLQSAPVGYTVQLSTVPAGSPILMQAPVLYQAPVTYQLPVVYQQAPVVASVPMMMVPVTSMGTSYGLGRSSRSRSRSPLGSYFLGGGRSTVYEADRPGILGRILARRVDQDDEDTASLGIGRRLLRARLGD